MPCPALPFSPCFFFVRPPLSTVRPFLAIPSPGQNDCQHTHRVEPCDPKKAAKHRKKGLAAPALPPSFAKGVVVSSSSSSGTVSGVCITWRAETALSAGAEVCNCYGLLMQDHALLQYGFLQVRVLVVMGGGGQGGC